MESKVLRCEMMSAVSSGMACDVRRRLGDEPRLKGQRWCKKRKDSQVNFPSENGGWQAALWGRFIGWWWLCVSVVGLAWF